MHKETCSNTAICILMKGAKGLCISQVYCRHRRSVQKLLHGWYYCFVHRVLHLKVSDHVELCCILGRKQNSISLKPLIFQYGRLNTERHKLTPTGL